VPTRIALIPLDERPVNVRYPQMIGGIAGAQVLVPPAEFGGLHREPADATFAADWLRESARRGDIAAAAVSCDFLAYGNLINSRISDDSAASAIGRLSVLEEIGAQIPVYAFSLITRVSNADDDVEEPRYWREWGTKFYEYARLTHQSEAGVLAPDEQDRLAELAATLPREHVSDWMVRRLRNHTVNLALMDMAARGRVASLLLTSDDTSAFGFPTRERDWLRRWLQAIGRQPAERIEMHPGADEVGSALVAKIVNITAKTRPSVWIEYAVGQDQEIVAPYEDRPVCETVLGQLGACGCIAAGSAGECDFVLGVATPSPRRTDYRPEFLEQDRVERTAMYADFLARLGAHVDAGRPVAIADVAYPNGSDPLLSEMLLDAESPIAPGSLAGYGAWNTAGNTLGTVMAQASCSLRMFGMKERLSAQNQFLTHRFLEDYGYQLRVRRQAREFALLQWGRAEPNPESAAEQGLICVFIEDRLNGILSELQSAGIGVGTRIVEGSTHLPWSRTFEVDFEVIEA
jgi:hypothetical protein